MIVGLAASVLARALVRPNKPVAAKYQKLVDTRRALFVSQFLTTGVEAGTA